MESKASSSLQGERLELLYHLSQAFNSSLDLDDVLNRVMDEVIRAMGAERGFIMLVGEGGKLEFMTARGLDHTSIEDPEFQISRGIVETVAQNCLPLLTSDAAQDMRFRDRQSVLSLQLRSILCVPLLTRDRLDGVIYVENRLLTGIFAQDDLDLLTAIAGNAAVAIENARLYKIAVEKGRMERELQMAYQVQESLLPSSLPSREGWDFSALWRPALEVAGDYYDVIPTPDGKVYLVIGDVTDKGMPASLFMVFTRSAIRASIALEDSLVAAMDRANRLLCLESGQGLFVTLFIGLLDPDCGGMEYVNAGHNPPLFLNRAGGFDRLTRTGIPLGIDPDMCYESGEIQFSPGDLLLLYTDGIPEAVDSGGVQFGMERLEDAVLAGIGESGGDLCKSVLKVVSVYAETEKMADDVTLVVVRRLDG